MTAYTNKEGNEMKSLNEITLYELMCENLDIWLTKRKKFGFDLEIDNEKNEPVIRVNGLHPYAAESFAEFCRSYLASYDRCTKGE